ncbi:RagB/SusD family nutrient uptake outer membrane protein [Pedobacter polaris]|uniref:RagB/SusD family nutrient uptake outer membrane protein n=1 Tax=Pedobacter polaris TaxID=2571273 RepID=A0A4U1CU70_9SPHI|nr:RagB/SusD family nutrient uptake outer membrane protein [Pedobacter polaris]TKC10665.1 RagB/SusD family nutrient uptake outer membrane protein [Pedobacter polaris]
MKTYFKYVSLVLFVGTLCCFSCKKFLDEKPDASLAVPTTLKDFQALLDQNAQINENDPSSGEVSAGEYYVTDADFLARTETDQRIYTWQNDNVLPALENDWAYCYRLVYRANTILNDIDKIEVNSLNALTKQDIKGQAFYHRAKAFLQAVVIWAPVYHQVNSNTDLGVPLRLNINFNEISVRATVKENYNQIVNDIKKAIRLLPEIPLHVVRPSKPAAYGLLSRTYLLMGDFENAKLYADSCLAIKSNLLDYNTLNATSSFPITQFNPEVIIASRMFGLPIIGASRAKIILELYNSYDVKDLRKTIYFKDNANGTFSFKGSYDGSSLYFSGIATDEIYLNRAECNARLGKIPTALSDLNALLKKRYKTGTYIDYNLTDQKAVLELILKERRKQLLMRGLRWGDIKRLNREGAGINLTRIINGKTYYLPANSARFALPIPEDVIALSGMPQNKY